MPFPDELRRVVLVEYRPRWRDEFETLKSELLALDLAPQGAIEHIGSTSVPGLIAKDVIDVQVRVPAIVETPTIFRFAEGGFRHRSEDWNNVEMTRTGRVRKLVFAGPVGQRPINVHVRADATTGARDALLFRDYLCADASARDAWGEFKRTLVTGLPDNDLLAYGRIKQPAWKVLMCVADAWARREQWRPKPLRPRPDL